MSSREVMYTHTFSVSFDVHSEYENPDDIDSTTLLSRLLLKATDLSGRIHMGDYFTDAFNRISVDKHDLCPGGGCELCDPSYHDYV